MLKKIKDIKSSISFARNSYSALTGVIVIAIVLILNLALQQLVGTSWDFDMSSNNLYEVTDITVEMLDDLDMDIEFTVLAEKSSTLDMIVTYIERYTALSDNISVEWIDPVLYPTALEEYNTSQNTMVISCAETGKSTVVTFDEIYYYDELEYYYYGTLVYEFDGEGLFTSAINQVTNTEEYKMYTVSGHGEGTLSDEVYDLLGKSSVTTEDLNLLTTSELPEDCDLLAIVAPTSDITDGELELLRTYMGEGGNLLLMLGETIESMPNFETLLLEYGLEVADGYIVDLERSYQGNGYYVIPNLYVSGDMATDIETGSVLIINTRGFTEVTPERDTITVDSFMTSSSNSYAVSETSEVSGTYVLGAISTETITLDDGTTTESNFTIYGSSNIVLSDVTEAFTSLENTTLFMNSIMANFEGSSNVSIEAKVIEDTYNVVDDTSTLSAIFIGVIPITILMLGFIVWNTRRKQ